MKTVAQMAKHPMVRLQQDLVAMLRATGSLEGAEQFWRRIKFDKRFGKKIAHYGFAVPSRQRRLNKVAFPECNFIEVDAALKAGNKLHQLYELACGRSSIARDPANQYKPGQRGFKIIKHSVEKRRQDTRSH
jgi:hypothetical protein